MSTAVCWVDEGNNTAFKVNEDDYASLNAIFLIIYNWKFGILSLMPFLKLTTLNPFFCCSKSVCLSECVTLSVHVASQAVRWCHDLCRVHCGGTSFIAPFVFIHIDLNCLNVIISLGMEVICIFRGTHVVGKTLSRPWIDWLMMWLCRFCDGLLLQKKESRW